MSPLKCLWSILQSNKMSIVKLLYMRSVIIEHLQYNEYSIGNMFNKMCIDALGC